MDKFWKETVWYQFGAAVDALENAIVSCPEDLWSDRSRFPEFWYLTYHTIFWIDFYLDEDKDNFKPPEPFGMEEMDPAGVLPPRVYTKDELLKYLKHCREKSHDTIISLTDERAHEQIKFASVDLSFAELILYVMRHIQHGAAQLNLILRQTKDIGSHWVFRAKTDID